MKIFFEIKSSFRDRQWDTVFNVPEGIEAVYDESQKPMGVVQFRKKSRGTLLGKIKSFAARNIPLVKIARRPAGDEIFYAWGALPTDDTKPFIVEFDNPYCATYYNRFAALLYRPYIQHKLRRAKSIACMSEACKAHLTSFYGQELASKAKVLYPFARNLDIKRTPSNEPRFLFIGMDHRIKGSEEVLEAFRKIPDLKAQLTFIAPLSVEIKNKYKEDIRIKFIEPMSRKMIMEEIYPNSDILIFPSMYESFGLVVLEALASGMGIISTNTYALPELVEHGRNGFLLHHPFIKPSEYSGRKVVDPIGMTVDDFSKKHFSHGEFYDGLCEEIGLALNEASRDFEKWKDGSREIFEEKFKESVWKDRFSKLTK